jgi:hypothetical protein
VRRHQHLLHRARTDPRTTLEESYRWKFLRERYFHGSESSRGGLPAGLFRRSGRVGNGHRLHSVPRSGTRCSGLPNRRCTSCARFGRGHSIDSADNVARVCATCLRGMRLSDRYRPRVRRYDSMAIAPEGGSRLLHRRKSPAAHDRTPCSCIGEVIETKDHWLDVLVQRPPKRNCCDLARAASCKSRRRSRSSHAGGRLSRENARNGTTLNRRSHWLQHSTLQPKVRRREACLRAAMRAELREAL